MAQELHVPSGGDEECKAKRFKSDCASKGWRCALGPAIKLAGGNRGGVAVMHRPWLDSVREDIIIPGQAVACWIHLSKIGIVIFISYYGHPERSDKQKKREELKAIFRYLANAGHPYLIGGDFNEEPKEVQDMIEEMGVPAMVNETEGWTCRGKETYSKIDFFVISKALSKISHTRATTVGQGLIAPHSPVEMRFIRAVGEEQILTVVRPKGTEPKRAVGPHKVYEWPELKRRTKDLILQLGIQTGGSTRALTSE